MNPKRSEAIKAFLNQNTHVDLAAIYNQKMEVQCNMAQDGGSRVDKHYKGKDWHEYTDGVQSWKTFRIPYNAWADPQDNDIEIKFDLSLHIEAIGMTGWNWVERLSHWFGYDFDAITNHSHIHKKKLFDNQLEEIKKAIESVPWVTLRKSTSGRGLHLYVYIDPIHTNNHNEHMALGRAILAQLSAICNYDFETKVDVNSGNMWVWHRKMRGTDGLTLIKQGNKLPPEQLPPNWKDYLDVVKGNRKKIIPFFIKEASDSEESERLFEELSGERPRIQLDSEHMKLINWIKDNNSGGSWWDDQHWMLVTHTYILKQAHEALNFKGIFKTLSTGRETGDYNSFMYPLRSGAWRVYRYTRGCAEDIIWTQDGQGWTNCYYNKIPSLNIAAKSQAAKERPAGGFVFNEAKNAITVCEMLGFKLRLPEWAFYRSCTLKKHKDGSRLIIEIDRDADKDKVDDMQDWVPEGKSWKRILDIKLDNQSSNEIPNFDRVIRHIVSPQGDNLGWMIKSDNEWKQEPLEHVKAVLEGSFGFKGNELKSILGSSVIQPWTIINSPFDPEYPQDRQWNRRAAQHRFKPSENLDNLNYPTWMKIFNHLGTELTTAIRTNDWCKENNILTGADYLLIWTASLFRYPFEQLPYLFFWSQYQNSGKSSFHEALALLLKGYPTPPGYMKADMALQPNTTFNGELQHSILCIVEETDLNRTKSGASIAYNRIKEWTTAKQVAIHIKKQTPYLVPNTSHWLHCANNKNACPIFPGDSRITMIHVPEIEPNMIIPKTDLLKLLEKEASDFMAEILRLEIPRSNDRLRVPVIETEDKLRAQQDNMTLVELFIKENFYYYPGKLIKYQDFYRLFTEQVESQYLETWTKTYTGRHLPPEYVKGRLRSADGQLYIGNISKTPRNPDEPPGPKVICKNDCLEYEPWTNSITGVAVPKILRAD